MLEIDYEIMTKILAKRVGEIASNLIHPDQAGFVPGRNLYAHIKLAQLIPEYAEEELQDGMIISLDQEKAYDKIDREYMWEILKKFEFPEDFINLVKMLHKDAQTSVMINGVIPTPIKILRGTRQGDPLSCLLYDLAIEPLACALIKTERLKGYTINLKKLIAKLFADDTLVYLNKKDKIKDLEKIIKIFCKVL